MKQYQEFKKQISEQIDPEQLEQLDETSLFKKGLVHLRKAMRGEKGAIPQPIAGGIRTAAKIARVASVLVPKLGRVRNTTALRFGSRKDMESREGQQRVKANDSWFNRGTGEKAVGGSPSHFDPSNESDRLDLGRWSQHTKGRFSSAGGSRNLGKGRFRDDTGNNVFELDREEELQRTAALADRERASRGHEEIQRKRDGVDETNGSGWKATHNGIVRYFPSRDEADTWYRKQAQDHYLYSPVGGLQQRLDREKAAARQRSAGGAHT